MKTNTLILLLLLALLSEGCADLNFRQGMYAYNKGDYIEAIQIWRPLAQEGNIEAQYFLGEMYVRSHTLPRDINEAISWWRRAAHKGHAASQVKLGKLYATGYGVKQDFDEAHKWYSKAAQQGGAIAQYNLASFYELGRSGMVNQKLAAYWFERAAKQGLTLAELKIAYLYETGVGVEQNAKKAVYWYHQALRGSFKKSLDFELLLTSNKDGAELFVGRIEAEQLYDAAVEVNKKDASYQLAMIYLEGRPDVKKRPRRSFKLIRELAKKGHIRAMEKLGDMFAEGLGTRKSLRKAMIIYNEAGKKGHAGSQAKLASLMEGMEEKERDPNIVVRLYELAARAGDASAQYRLGQKFEKGKGIAEDRVSAYMWYSMAATGPNQIYAKSARLRLEKLSEELTPSQLFEAQSRLAVVKH